MDWAKQTFRLGNHLQKARNEIEEFDKSGEVEECADVIIAMFAAADSKGYTAQEVFDAIDKKMAVNYTRAWLKQEDGTYQHVDYTPRAGNWNEDETPVRNPPPFTEGHNPFGKGGVYTPGDPWL